MAFSDSGSSAISEQPCNTCGMLSSQCSCSPTSMVFHVNLNSGTSAAQTGWQPFQPAGSLQPATFVGGSTPAFHCVDHEMDQENLILRDGEVQGFCKNCAAKMTVPNLGGFTFEEAGAFVGRAMSLEEDDDENAGELLAELMILEKKIAKEESRLRRARKMIVIARINAEKRAKADLALDE